MKTEQIKKATRTFLVALVSLFLLWGFFVSIWPSMLVYRDTGHFTSLFFLTDSSDAPIALSIGEHYLHWVEEDTTYNREKAADYFMRAHELDQQLSGPTYQWGRTEFLIGRYANALSAFDVQWALYENGAQTDQYTLPTQYMRALTNGLLGNFDVAEKLFLSLVRDHANDSRSWTYYNNLAWLYFQQGKFDDMEILMEEAIKQYPENPWILNMYGLALLNHNKNTVARDVFLRAQERANELTASDWLAAYPGNDPYIAQQGIAELKNSIAENVRRAEEHIEEGAHDNSS